MLMSLGRMARHALGYFQKRQRVYRRVFKGSDGDYVLADIYRFCNVDRQTYDLTNSNDVLYAEGMRRVALHIHQALNESADDMLKRAESYNDHPQDDEVTGQAYAQDIGQEIGLDAA